MAKEFSKRAVTVRAPSEGESREMTGPDELLELAARLASRHHALREKSARRPLWPCVISFLIGCIATAAALWAVTMWMI